MKKYLIFILLPLVLVVLFAASVYVYDPIQIFHKSWLDKDPCLSIKMEVQAAGIINSYDFNSVILGTSMMENSSANEASTLLGGDFVNISLSGGDFYERSFLLNYLLTHKKIDKTIYSLDFYAYYQKRTRKTRISKYSYLYDNSRLNDVLSYTDSDIVKELARPKRCPENCDRMQYHYEWINRNDIKQKFGGMENWFKNVYSKKSLYADYETTMTADNAIDSGSVKYSKEADVSGIIQYIDKYVLSYVENTPDTQFIFIFPPYTRLYYAIMAQTRQYEYSAYVYVIRYLVKQQSQLSNMSVYGFDDTDFPDDIKNYKDMTHYSPKVNSYMTRSISEHKHRLTSENIDSYIDNISAKAAKYDIRQIAKEMRAYNDKYHCITKKPEF